AGPGPRHEALTVVAAAIGVAAVEPLVALRQLTREDLLQRAHPIGRPTLRLELVESRKGLIDRLLPRREVAVHLQLLLLDRGVGFDAALAGAGGGLTGGGPSRR